MSIEVPVCKGCQKHQTVGYLAYWLPAILLFVLFGAQFLYMANTRPEGVRTGKPSAAEMVLTGLLFGYLVVGGIGLWMYRRFLWPRKNPGHSRAGKPMKMKISFGVPVLTLRNESYGELFLAANHGWVKREG